VLTSIFLGMRLRLLFLCVVAVSILAGCRGETPPPAPELPEAAPITPGTAASLPIEIPDIRLEDLVGEDTPILPLLGKVTLVNFWATWCPPCRQETPDLVRLHADYGAQGLQVIGISLDLEGPEKVGPFVEEFLIDYPILMGTQETADLFGLQFGLPVTLIVDEQGRILRRIMGVFPTSQIRPLIEDMLQS